ncbi:MAG: hypothetical protein M3454_00920 [Actinomycetota bacterium]|nr:hypothetical protein [Actinomycetota bacterium]
MFKPKLAWLLIFVPAAVVLELTHADPVAIFVGGPHSSAIFLAAKDKMDVSVEIAVGSSTQIALFVAPMLVFVSLLVGQPMDLIFSGIEIAAVAFSALILGFITLDARSNWIEGAQLVAAYLIMAVSFFFL